jgi:hypothetical protein
VPVGVAHVAADLPAVDLGWGEELGPAGAPRLVGGLDIGHPEVEEGAGASGIGRWFEYDLGFVIGRSSTGLMMTQPLASLTIVGSPSSTTLPPSTRCRSPESGPRPRQR